MMLQGDADTLARMGARLRIDAATAELFGALARNGVAALLLKGPSLARWLYDDPAARTYVDADVLVGPADLPAAEHTLKSLGYERRWDDRAMPDWWQEHAGDWARGSDGSVIDLHRRLPGMHAAPVSVWDALWATREEMEVAGRALPVLGEPARALHVALHAAHHGREHPQPLRDLERAIERVERSTWRAAAELAGRLGAAEALGTGLRLAERGVELARGLGSPPAVSAAAELRAASPPPTALGFAQLAAARSPLERLRILVAKAVPPPAFIRHWDPRAARGTLPLLKAYARRPVWLARHAPRGWAAFRTARRRVERR